MSEFMREIIETTGRQPEVFTERDALKLVAEPLRKLKAAPADEQLAFVFEALQGQDLGTTFSFELALKGVTAALLRGGLELNSLQALRIVEMVSRTRGWFPYKAILSALTPVARTEALKAALKKLRPCIDEWHGGTLMKELHQRIDELVDGPKHAPVAPASPGWTMEVLGQIDGSERRVEWLELFDHARSLSQSTAPKKWLDAAVRCVEAVGRPEFLEAAARWLALGPTPGLSPQLQVPDEEADYQKGFVWTVGTLGEVALAPALADFALACFRKIPMIGAVSHRVGNACVNALAAMPGLAAVSQLSRLANRVKYDVAKRLVEKALTEAASRNGVTRDDLEAMSVPSFGLDAAGKRVEAVGECEARIEIRGSGVGMEWWRGGKALKSVPAEAKRAHAELVKDLQRSEKELSAILSTQRLRLERLLMSTGSTAFASWRQWYLDNPVVAAMAARLIWTFEREGKTETGFAHEGRIVDWAGNEVKTDSATRVRLWHPIQSDVQTVVSWRCWLEDRGIQQPFKQAHREVYLLTDAERVARIVSRRFAGHVLKQHQFAALARERGWQYNLMGQWDSHNTPYLELPNYGMRAEFWVEFPNGDGDDAELTGHAVYKLIGTEHVDFRSLTKLDRPSLNPYPEIPLADVPPVVFSEVMRDVDLFVGVTSIGADPAWGANRENPHFDYWRAFSFGELAHAAEARQSVLERLLPRFPLLKSRCWFEGRFLVVRGSLCEYRIHLGSGNVMMEPGSRYLCIVQGAGDPAATVHLPFEGDRILSLILSKALLLASDEAIKDETILRQIRV